MEGWRARGWAKELKGVQGFRCACALSLSRPIAGHPPVHTSPFYTKRQGDLLPSGQSVRLKELKTLKPKGPGFDSQGGVLLLLLLLVLLLLVLLLLVLVLLLLLLVMLLLLLLVLVLLLLGFKRF